MKNLFLYSFLHLKLKKKCRTCYMDSKEIKEVLKRTIIRKGGIPGFMVKYIVEDLIKLGLVEREHQNRYKILDNPCENKTKLMINSYF